MFKFKWESYVSHRFTIFYIENLYYLIKYTSSVPSKPQHTRYSVLISTSSDLTALLVLYDPILSPV